MASRPFASILLPIEYLKPVAADAADSKQTTRSTNQRAATDQQTIGGQIQRTFSRRYRNRHAQLPTSQQVLQH